MARRKTMGAFDTRAPRRNCRVTIDPHLIYGSNLCGQGAVPKKAALPTTDPRRNMSRLRAKFAQCAQIRPQGQLEDKVQSTSTTGAPDLPAHICANT
jgi:hypothetical protein